MRKSTIFAALVAALGAGGAVVACGSRTGLDALDETAIDGGLTEADGALPLLDARPRQDAPVSVFCADASDTLVYAITSSRTLLRFDPSSGSFTPMGIINCPDPRSPFSMAVDRRGVAYVLYALAGDTTPGAIFRVSLETASCASTSFDGSTLAFDSFGMGFSADSDGGETLYIASDDTPNGRLGAVNPNTFAARLVGAFNPPVIAAELTGTGDGRLYAFYAPGGVGTAGAAIAEIDKTTAQVIGQSSIPSVTVANGWAFAFWGGSFYMFTAPSGASSLVQRYDPSTKSTVTVASYPETIVGAGVSTCAPVK